MARENNPVPASFKGVMVSSTFKDLEKHRKALMEALQKEKLVPIGMEDYVVKPDDDVISSSLNMVHESSAYIGLISHRCGDIPECSERNPDSYSITRLEFEEAQKLGLPTIIFVMGDKHPGTREDFEVDPEKVKKLEAFRKRAKEGRIYVKFDSLEKFTNEAIHAVGELRRYLDEQAAPVTKETESDPIPTPPEFYAEPPYIGSHKFLGRQAQLDTLNDWATPADSHPILLFEAIGGAGKSILTWEWVNNHATKVRDDWAGRLWYSFYEKGAIMADFCARALAYITGQPFDDFKKKKTPELGDMLLHHLKDKPYLIVFDGLERVLVAFHRYDAAQITDEDVDTATDQIADRDQCAAIHPEDDELLRTLAGASPSKLLLTSRLTPDVLLNASNQPIQGVVRNSLPGLRPSDAEKLFNACNVSGDSKAIQDYLKAHCDCHPLVIGVLAGLIIDYLPDRGNFDAWAVDPNGGGQLNLADLDLVQKRNHILKAALDAIDDKGKQLLSTLALLSESVDYPTLCAFNPHLPPEPEKVEEPENPEESWRWRRMSDEEKAKARKDYKAAIQQQKDYEQALKAHLDSPKFLAAPKKLQETVRDLEQRGLLQYDPQSKRHDLHPVVRGIAAGGLEQEEMESYGQRVVDHFSQRAHSPYDEAETLEDVRDGLHIVRTLLQMGRHQQAYDAYSNDLHIALLFNLEAPAETLSLLQPFFPHGWATLPNDLKATDRASLVNSAAVALDDAGQSNEALSAFGASLQAVLQQEDWNELRIRLSNIALTLGDQNSLAKADFWILQALDLASQLIMKVDLFRARLVRFDSLVRAGQWQSAETMWRLLDPMGRNWPRSMYRPGEAERCYAKFLFQQGKLKTAHLDNTEQIANAGRTRIIIRQLHALRGEWQLEQKHYELAAASLNEAVRMAREVGQTDADAETQLALAKFHLGQLPEACQQAERLAKVKKPFHRFLAELWLAIGDHEQAKEHALAAYKWAWADGEPYVRRYELNKTIELLERLGVEKPDLPPYDPDKDEKLPWEDDVVAAIEKLKAEKEAEKVKKARKKGKGGR